MNFVLLKGRLGSDPKAFANGKIAAVNIAVSHRSKNATTGKWDSKVNWIKIKAFGTVANWLMQCKKGEEVIVTGALRENQFETQGGRKTSELNVIIDAIHRGGSIPWPEKVQGELAQEEPEGWPDDRIKTEAPWANQPKDDEDVPF